MPRRVSDPWAKKSKKGMKTLGKMFDVSTKIGAAVYSSSKTKQKTTTPKDSCTTSNTIPTSTVGCLVFVIGVIVALIVLFTHDDFVDGISDFFLILSITILLYMLTSYMFPNGSKCNSQSTKTPEESECEK